MSEAPIQEAPERVLSTLNKDGSRRWLRPRLSTGRWWRRRWAAGWALIIAFSAIPWLKMNGKPLMLFDLPAREFTLFGTTFFATDSLLLMLLMVGILLSIFLLTALLGRVWCGWACPQTVYMEFLFRPIERLIEGDHLRQHQLDQQGLSPRRLLKHGVFLLVSAWLANTFLAYWVGWDVLLGWVTRPPAENWAGFLVMAVTTALVFIDFAWFREQTCIVACPYGRLQSVLLDADSLIVAYDNRRGEPREKARRGPPPEGAGDCVDCNHCVVVCPTGIDIREGLQMECVHCTQCIDACDAVMEKLHREPGLIRYGSQQEMAHGRRRWLRPRVVLYPLALALVFGLLVVKLAGRASAEVTVLRAAGEPYALVGADLVGNTVRLKIANRGSEEARYWIHLLEPAEATAIVPVNPLPVRALGLQVTTVVVRAPRTAFDDGRATAIFAVTDSSGYEGRVPVPLIGPRDGDEGAR
jgi:cytochrome c oxidase accessory protein FixG